LGVIYIGDRRTGKTALMIELACGNPSYVKVLNPSCSHLKGMFWDDNNDRPLRTEVIPGSNYYSQTIQVEVKLPASSPEIPVDWLDTAGETWQKTWQENNSDEWQDILTGVNKSKAIILTLNPYREIINEKLLDPDTKITDFPLQQQWINRFERWVKFFIDDCPNVMHIILCLNKADLFCNIEAEATELSYNPYGSRRNWSQRNSYITQKYFYNVSSQINTLNEKKGGIVRCFITTIKNRPLLELPWIYLGSHLS
jgi:hypothetical protein